MKKETKSKNGKKRMSVRKMVLLVGAGMSILGLVIMGSVGINGMFRMQRIAMSEYEDAADQGYNDQITGLGTVTKDSKAGIDAARSAYDALSDMAKAYVSNYADLEKAESDYKALTES